MNCDLPVSVEGLTWFQKRLGLEKADLDRLKVCRDLFIKKKEFAETFYKYFREIPETRIQIEHERRRGHLKKAWTKWFESLFKKGFSGSFLAYHWRSGLRHVEVNVDYRFITLAYSLLRQYCPGDDVHLSSSEQPRGGRS